MKKILAIALAVAMVLSMASASAFFCDGINWTCNTNTIKCGLPTIEVVEMVRSNSVCGYDFVESGCAAVVAGMPVYFAVKLTIPEDVNPEWLAGAAAYLKTTKTAAYGAPETKVERAYTRLAELTKTAAAYNADTAKSLGAGTYWLQNVETTVTDATDVVLTATTPVLDSVTGAGTANTNWVKVGSDFTFSQRNVFFATALNAGAKVCAKIESASSDGHLVDINVGDYTVQFHEGTDVTPAEADDTEKLAGFTVTDGTRAATIVLDKADGKVIAIRVAKAQTDTDIIDGGDKQYVGYATADASKFSVVDASTATGYSAEEMGCNEAKFVKDIMGVFGFDFGTCCTYKAVKKTFGFGGTDDAVVSCSDYKVGTSAIVDAACEISIPKTGDASVIAYAVMALVAAAGAMGLKK